MLICLRLLWLRRSRVVVVEGIWLKVGSALLHRGTSSFAKVENRLTLLLVGLERLRSSLAQLVIVLSDLLVFAAEHAFKRLQESAGFYLGQHSLFI